MRSHMALRKLAGHLEREGFHVLRFDYFGTGDSAGGAREGSLDEWRTNIVAALEDLKDRSGVTKVSIVGFRLGATLAAQTNLELTDLVLWEPVVRGSDYLEELRQRHRHEFSSLLFPPELADRGCGCEVLGSPLTREMEAEIAQIDLTTSFACHTEHIVLIAGAPTPGLATLSAWLTDGSSRPSSESHFVPDESRSDEPDAMLLATQAVQTAARALVQRAG